MFRTNRSFTTNKFSYLPLDVHLKSEFENVSRTISEEAGFPVNITHRDFDVNYITKYGCPDIAEYAWAIASSSPKVPIEVIEKSRLGHWNKSEVLKRLDNRIRSTPNSSNSYIDIGTYKYNEFLRKKLTERQMQLCDLNEALDMERQKGEAYNKGLKLLTDEYLRHFRLI